jgi:hypothetical protein
MSIEQQATIPDSFTPAAVPVQQTPTAPTVIRAELDHPETAKQKRERLLSSGGLYRDTPVYQAAAQTWATVELMEATELNTAAIRQQSAIEAQKLDELHLANVLAFYAMNSAVFPPGVEAQLKAALGISAAAVVPSAVKLARFAAHARESAATPSLIEAGVDFD